MVPVAASAEAWAAAGEEVSVAAEAVVAEAVKAALTPTVADRTTVAMPVSAIGAVSSNAFPDRSLPIYKTRH